jgi:hypothetical protein
MCEFIICRRLDPAESQPGIIGAGDVYTSPVRFTYPDGTSEEQSAEIGVAVWADSEEHLPENVGEGPIEVVLVELKN